MFNPEAYSANLEPVGAIGTCGCGCACQGGAGGGGGGGSARPN